MPVHDELGKRMKKFYEQVPKTRLIRRCPVAIRLDGKAFHTFTRGFQKPFDEIIVKSMQETMKYLCKNIQGCVLGYTQSDEITLILVDYQKLNSEAWFDYETQKMCSVAASMATMMFNKVFKEQVDIFYNKHCLVLTRDPMLGEYEYHWSNEKNKKLFNTYQKAHNKGAMFDARCFNVPKEEVTNAFYWRQIDAIRNSIQMLGQAYFSHTELDHKNQRMIKEMLLEKHIDWNELPIYLQRGSCCIKEEYYIDNASKKEISVRDTIHSDEYTTRTRWIIDKEIPIFKDEGREYIEKLINFD